MKGLLEEEEEGSGLIGVDLDLIGRLRVDLITCESSVSKGRVGGEMREEKERNEPILSI